jgi:hypothetical protein
MSVGRCEQFEKQRLSIRAKRDSFTNLMASDRFRQCHFPRRSAPLQMPTPADLKKAHLNLVNKKIAIIPINSDRSTLAIYESELVDEFNVSRSADRFQHAIRETRINKASHGATLSTAVTDRKWRTDQTQ